MKYTCKFSFFILLFFCFQVNGQTEFDTEALEISNSPADTNQVIAWIELSKMAMSQNYNTAMTFADSALKLSKKIGYVKGEYAAKKKKSDGLNYSGRYEEAFAYTLELRAYYERTEDKLNSSRIISNMALIKRNQSQFEEAMSFYFEALKIKEEIGDSSGVAYVLNNIAITYAIQGEVEDAIPYFYKARRLYERLGEETRFYSVTLDIGGLNLEKGNLDSALYYVQTATTYFEAKAYKANLGRCYYLLGRVYQESEDYEKSEAVLRKTVALFLELGNLNRAAGAMLRQSELAEIQGEYKQAEEYCFQSLKTLESIDAPNVTFRTYYQLYNLYKKQGLYQEALKYKELHDELKDEVNSKTNKAAIAELEEKYQTEQKERLVAELKAQNQEAEIKVKRQWIQQLILIAALVIIVILALAFYNRARAKKATNQMLLAKNEIIEKALRDKEFLFREVHHRVKNNLQFISSLLNLQSRHIADPGALGILTDARNRVKSMALVHQKLYQEENLTGVDMKTYMSNLVDSLAHSFNINEEKVSIELNVDRITLDIDTAIPVGIIFNELITNSFKHAFSEKTKGKLKVELKEKNTAVMLKVEDNGKGIKEDNLEATFGLQLIDSMVDKLKAKLVTNSAQGHNVEIIIPKNDR